jgi:hypothetical protein
MCQVADRFFAAVRTLTSDEPVKQRLVAAYVDHLAAVSSDDLPEAIRPRFELLRQAMQSQPASEKETAVQVSVRKMSQADAGRYTRSILAMFAELVRVKATGERLATGEPGVRQPTATRITPRSLGPDVRLPSFLARP